MIEATIHIVWDETGRFAAHADASEAADLLDADSDGRFRRVLALKVKLPASGPIDMSLDVTDRGETAAIKSAKIT